MRAAFIATCFALAAACGASVARAQTDEARPGEARVPLLQAATALDAGGRAALEGRLRTQSLAGTHEAPVRNTRVVVRNLSQFFYNYAAGWATFYDAEGVRCGEGLWKLEAFAPGESVEVDTPGIRLTCSPETWRLVATTLLTRTTDVAKPGDQAAPQPADEPAGAEPASAPPPPTPPLEININGRTIPLQLGNPLEVTVGRERVRLVVQPAP